MALVAEALGAMNFAIFAQRHRHVLGGEVGFNRAPEARPARAGIEFPFRAEKLQTTAHALEDPAPVFAEQRAGERALRAFLAKDMKGRRRKPCAPLLSAQPPPRRGGEAALVGA